MLGEMNQQIIGHQPIVKYLIEKGVDVRQMNYNGETIIHNNYNGGYTALHNAVQEHKLECYQQFSSLHALN